MDIDKMKKEKQLKVIMPEPLSHLTTFGYGIGHLLNDLCSALWFTYSLIYYTVVIGFSSAHSGIIMFVGQLADALATPVIGIWSDRYSLPVLSIFGMRKSWYVLGSFMVMATMPFMYSPCINCTQSDVYLRLLYYSFFVVIFQFGWAAVQTVHLALVTDLSFISDERTTLLSLRNTFTVISNIAVYIVAFIVLRYADNEKQLSSKDTGLFQIMAATIVVVGGISSLIFFFTVKEEPQIPLLEEDERRASTRSTHVQWLKKWMLYHVGMIYMGSRIYCNVVQSMITLYLQQSLHLSTYTIALIPLAMYVSSFVTSILSGIMTRILGKKLTFLTGVLLGLSACIWIEFDSSPLFKQYFVYIVAILLGGGSSIILVVALAITSDLIGSDTGNSAFVYGLMSFIDKLSCGVVILAIQAFEPGADPMYYTHSLSFACGLSAIFAGLFVIFLPTSLLTQRDFSRGPTESVTA